MTTLKFADQTIITISGDARLHIGDASVQLDFSNDNLVYLLTVFLRRSRKAETEQQLVVDTLAGDWDAVIAGSGASSDDFEFPASLQALTSDFVSLSRAKGKVTPGSIDVIMTLQYGKDRVAAMRTTLEAISGFIVVNKKPLPVSDSDGMPIAVKYIVSPLAK